MREIMKDGVKKNTSEKWGKNVKLSMCLMGLGQFFYGRGLCYLAILLLAVVYFVYRGFSDLIGLFTLGTKEADTWLGLEGDNSVVMLLMGILSVIALLFFVFCFVFYFVFYSLCRI